MTTRSLDAPAAAPPFEHPTRPAGGAPTSPTYTAAPMMAPFYDNPPYHTNPPSSNKTALFVILGLVMAVLIGAGIVGFIVLGRFSHRPIVPPPPPVPSSSAPQPGSGGIVPHPPITPPPPPPPGRGSVKTSLEASLRYPGAEVVMEVNSGDGAVTQLHTTDDIDKVTDWYVEKIKPKKHVRIPGGSVLDGDNIKVLLTSGGDDTSIQVIRKNGD